MKSKQVQEFKETEIGKIPTDWEVARLKDISTLYVPMRNKPKEFDGNIPWLKIEDLDGKYASDSKQRRYVTHDVVDKMHLRILPIGTVLCSCTATIGLCAITQKEVVTNQQFIGIHTSDMDNQFLYYYLLTQTRNLINNAYGTIGGYITRKRFEDFQIILPPISEQKLIVKILSDLDSTIENIQHQNPILEQIAQAIFKSWFVDFDGVTEFEDSELGKIPKGWSSSLLSEYIQIKKGKKPKVVVDYPKEGYVPQILIETLNGGKFSYADPKNMITSNVTDTIMVMDGISSGRVSIGYDGVIGSTLAKLTSKNNPYFFYFLVKNLESILKLNTTGSAIPHTDKHLLMTSVIIIPTSDFLDKFEEIICKIQKQITKNEKSISILTKTRDALLPKLMSGEIRV